jgi:hypothetical protein
MADTDTSAMRIVNGWEVHVRKAPWETRWEISLCDRVLNLHTALMDGELRSQQMVTHPILRQTFASPDEAAQAFRQLLG